MVETLGRVHLVTEYIQGGELYNRITQDGPLKEIYAASLFKQLLHAVQHMVGALFLTTFLFLLGIAPLLIFADLLSQFHFQWKCNMRAASGSFIYY